VPAILFFFSTASGLAADQQGPASVGTAFAVSGKGHLLTAYHVVREKTQIFVGPLPNGRWTLATVRRVDVRHDLVLLQISIDTEPLVLAEMKEEPPVGLSAYVLGFPRPQSRVPDLRITSGLLSGQIRSANRPNSWIISAPVQRGNSGGPVLAPDGGVMGMVQSVIAARALKEGSRIIDVPQNVNLALPAEELMQFLKASGIEFKSRHLDIQDQTSAVNVYRRAKPSVFAVVGLPSPLGADQP
jgi:serine protease Do